MSDGGQFSEIGPGLDDAGVVILDIERDLLDLADQFLGMLDFHCRHLNQ